MISIIPAIDIINGKCVRLSKGEYSQAKTYSENPLEIAKQMEDVGCTRLHLVDLDGAKSKHIVNYNTIERIATHTNLIIDFGGGVKTDEDIHIAFESGAQMITGGSIAIQDPTTFKNWLAKYSGDKIILGADARNGKIATSGWTEDSDKDIIPFIKEYQEIGVTQVISTDINKDGMLQGPAFDLYKSILDEIPQLQVIASGGISCFKDIMELNNMGVPGVIVGKAIYENRIPLSEIERFNAGKIC